MKKLVIYKKTTLPNGKTEKSIIRSIGIDPSFIGFGNYGYINHKAFKDLADYYEPVNDGYYIA